MENQKKKLKLILAGSGKFALQIVEKIQKDERIDFIGVICDQAAGGERFPNGVLENIDF